MLAQDREASIVVLSWLRKINSFFTEKCYEYWLKRCKLMEEKKHLYKDLDDWIEENAE